MHPPTLSEREEHLLLLYFGATPPGPLGRCVRRAYRDLNRTLHGMAVHRSNRFLQQAAPALLEDRLSTLVAAGHVASQDSYDAWHEEITRELCALYRSKGFRSFSVGQGQKWINMALKYAVLFGEERLGGTSRLYPWLHVPIDNIILAVVSERRGPGLTTPWSRLQDYGEYLEVQKWFRVAFPTEAPLTVEFRLWQSGMSKGGAPAA